MSPSRSKWAEYILFASLLVAVCVIFSIMAHFYTYIDPTEIEAQFKKKPQDDDDDKGQPKVKMAKKDSMKRHNEGDANHAVQTKL